MSKFYNLIGAEVPLDPWVITYQDLPPELPTISHHTKVIPAMRWPLLFFHQIPERFLKSDPGFPILLRQEIQSNNLPCWIKNPIIPDTKDHKDKYCISTIKNDSPQTILFVVSQAISVDWPTLKELHPAKRHFWIWLGVDARPALPIEYEMTFIDITYFKKITPDHLVDLNFGQLDTYGAIHLYCLRYGATLDCLSSYNFISLRPKHMLSIGVKANIHLY